MFRNQTPVWGEGDAPAQASGGWRLCMESGCGWSCTGCAAPSLHGARTISLRRSFIRSARQQRHRPALHTRSAQSLSSRLHMPRMRRSGLNECRRWSQRSMHAQSPTLRTIINAPTDCCRPTDRPTDRHHSDHTGPIIISDVLAHRNENNPLPQSNRTK